MNIHWLVDLVALLRKCLHSCHPSLFAAACLMVVLASVRGADATQPGVPDAPAKSGMGEDPYLWLEDVSAERSLNWVGTGELAQFRTHSVTAAGYPGFEGADSLRHQAWALLLQFLARPNERARRVASNQLGGV